MGKKGKPTKSKGGKPKGKPGAGAGAAAAAAAGYAVSKSGTVMRMPVKRRKKSYRMPRYVAESMRQQNEMMRTISQAVLLSALHK